MLAVSLLECREFDPALHAGSGSNSFPWAHDGSTTLARGAAAGGLGAGPPAPPGDARCGDAAINVPTSERTDPDAKIEGTFVLSSKLLKLLSSCSV